MSEGLARSCIGRSYLAEDVLAEAETMRAFARAACDPNPRYLDGDIVNREEGVALAREMARRGRSAAASARSRRRTR